ncbi:MAG: hypothetical protein ABSB35_08455 [Bryobacteraceae bacterium]
MRIALFLIAATLALAQTPQDVVEFFRDVAGDLAQNNPSEFLDHFDRNMVGYATLRDEIESLLSAAEVGSAIEIVTDEGDDQKRTLELDWVLEITDQQPKRAILKCTIARQGKKWKITALDPIEFFKYS